MWRPRMVMNQIFGRQAKIGKDISISLFAKIVEKKVLWGVRFVINRHNLAIRHGLD